MIQRLISSVFITIALLYFMINTTSPKIIFVPFLICSISMFGQTAARISNNKKYISIFHKLFVIGFSLFWFGFLIVACYLSFRDGNYSMIVFSLPFWIVGTYFVRKKWKG